MTQQDAFTIKLPAFEGPFDLLLFFIERDELDIYNIPIATITNDFLEYMHQMKSLNIDLASEFIVVAATLMRIKAKILLPRKQIDEEGNEVDPRQELVDRLLEYKRYKSVLDELRKLEEIRSYMLPRGNAGQEFEKLSDWALNESELESVTLYRLMRTFARVVERYEDSKTKKMVHRVYSYNYSIGGQKSFLRETLQIGVLTRFEELFYGLENRVHAIVTFLALLELLNDQTIRLIQGEGVNDFSLTLSNPEEIETPQKEVQEDSPSASADSN